MIAVVLAGLIIGEELWLPLLEELGMLVFEWGHKTLDLLFSEVLGLADEASQKASAWTGLLLILILLGWSGYVLRMKYRRLKAATPLWWAERKASLRDWWINLPWFYKLAHISVVLILVGILAMLI